MSEAKIQFHIPGSGIANGDFNETLSAIGAFEHSIPHPFDHEYTVEPVMDKPEDGGVMVTLIRTPREPQTKPTLLEYGERMKQGVESRLPDERRARIMGHFVGILPIDALEDE